MAVPDIKAVIFDCFGVLYVDSSVSLRSTVSGERRSELEDVFVRNNYGYLSRDEYVAAISGITHLTEREVEEYIAKEHSLNTELIDLISGRLDKIYKIGLLSNIGRGWINDFFNQHQLHDLFQAIVLSGEEGLAKPHPAIFELMATRLGVKPSECVMIDDIVENCEGAQMAGMQTIHYTSNPQLLTELSDIGII